MPSRFVPSSWQLSDKQRQWTLDYRTVEGQRIDPVTIDRLEEEFRDVEFPAPRRCFDRCWRRFIRNQVEWGKAKLISPRRQPEELSPEQRQADILKFERDMERFGAK